MPKSLKETLKEIQILLGKPQKEIAGTLKYYLNFFQGQNVAEKETDTPRKKEKLQTIHYKNIIWTDIKNPTRAAISQLAQKYPFHPLHLEDCISKWQFPKIEQNDEDNYLFLLFRFPHYIASEGRIIINQLYFFLGKEYLVTIHEDGTDTISNIFNECKDNSKQKEAYFNGSSAHLLNIIIDRLTNELSPLVQVILKEVDEVEDIVFDDKVSGVYKVGQLRRKIISLRRVIGPLRTLLSDLENRIKNFTSSNLSIFFENNIHRVDKTWETLEEAREIVEIYKDADFTISTEKTSRILAVLTIIFTLSIPLTVIGTFYGMNILLPGGIETGNWTFWGKYTTLLVILLVAAAPSLLMFWYFRKRGWF